MGRPRAEDLAPRSTALRAPLVRSPSRASRIKKRLPASIPAQPHLELVMRVHEREVEVRGWGRGEELLQEEGDAAAAAGRGRNG